MPRDQPYPGSFFQGGRETTLGKRLGNYMYVVWCRKINLVAGTHYSKLTHQGNFIKVQPCDTATPYCSFLAKTVMLLLCFNVSSFSYRNIKVDCISVSTSPVKSTIDDHIQQLFDTLLTSLRRSITNEVQTIDTFLTSATEALSSRPQTVEEIGVANAKHSELATEKLQVII